MLGTLLNIAGILLGGIAGLITSRPLSAHRQSMLKVGLGAFTVWTGLKLTWMSLNGNLLHIGKQLLIVVLALTLGRLIGRLLHLQKGMNRLGRFARDKIAAVQPDAKKRPGEGFITGAVLFCAAPLAVLGAAQDGLTGNWQPLAIKALIDGLAAMAFVPMFGWGVLLAVVPVAAYQCGLTLGAHWLEPFLTAHHLMDTVNATSGLLIFCVALLILELRKIEVGDYLPALAFAPLLTWLWS